MNENNPIPITPRRWIDTVPIESTDKPASIAALETEVHVRGLHVHITQTIVIENPNDRNISVPITIQLPDRASVCGYALEIDGQMIEGVVVPKEKARVAFETEQRRGADPGLVEAVKGNVYQTRVYPVPALGTRKVSLEISAPLLVSGSRAFIDVPMPAEHLSRRVLRISCELHGMGAPEISGVNVGELVDDGICWTAHLEDEDVENTGCLRIALPKLPDRFCVVERDETGQAWFCASEKVPAAKTPDKQVKSVCVLWDVSGSRAYDHAPEIEIIRSLCDDVTDITLIPFGFKVYKSSSFEDKDALIAAIEKLDYDGGSDFAALASFLAEEKEPKDAYVLFTDGMDTLSNTPMSFDRTLPLIAIISGSTCDFEAARQACSGRAFDVTTAPKTKEELISVLYGNQALTSVDGEGIASIAGIGSGTDGRFTAIGKVDATTDVTFSPTGSTFHLDVENALSGKSLSRSWAVMRVATLSARAADNADELLSLGHTFGVVSPETSLLVLEDLDQWLRYDIEPPVTWTSMHEAWEKARPGIMNVGSEQEAADRHLASLKTQWAQVKKWWEEEHGKSVPADPSRCSRCGNPLEGSTSFCPHCGNPIAAPIREAVESRGMTMLGRARAALDGALSNVMPAPRSSGHIHHRMMDIASEAPMEDMAAGMAAPDMAYRAAAPMAADFSAMECATEMPEAPDDFSDTGDEPRKSVEIKAWTPDAEYLKALDEAVSAEKKSRKAYLDQRSSYATSPSFFFDCATWFFAHEDNDFAVQVLSNLVEMRIEDAALLRVMGWRLREAGELKRSLDVLRRVLDLRHEDSQSHRDLALVLDELARFSYEEGDEEAAKAYAEEAGTFYRETATTPWLRRPMAIALFAVEEYNVLRAWADSVKWKSAPDLPSLGEDLEGVLASDIRVTLAWDADETDVDIHVTEPGGEEAYYGNRFTYIGGRVSEDITDGYGPELYEIKDAVDGVYVVRAHYFASHQQAVFGPANCTLTVFTDWGRPTQSKQVTSTRLENAKEMVDVGRIVWGDVAESTPEEVRPTPTDIVKGCSVDVLVAILGEPVEGDATQDGELTFSGTGERVFVATIEDGACTCLIEQTAWGDKTVLFQ